MGTNRLVACTDTGKLTIDGVSCHIDGCWTCLNVEELWTANAARGGNVVIPGSTGRRSYAWRVDESIYTLAFVFSGENDHNGVAWDSPWYGLQRNIEYFRSNVVAPPAAPTATVSASLLMPDGSTRTANVQPRILTVAGGGGSFVNGVLELVVPAGRFS